MKSVPTETIGEQTLIETSQRLKESFGERVMALYALGSLAHGGFAPSVSDIDIGLVLHAPLLQSDEDCIRKVTEEVSQTNLPLADRVSIFWGALETINSGNGGRFPPLDRLDLIESGRLLYGIDIRNKMLKPSHSELVIEGARFALTLLRNDQNKKYIESPKLLFEAGQRKLTKLILFPVRFLYTLRTGQIGKNDAAVAHYALTTKDAKGKLALAGLAWRDETLPESNETNMALIQDNLIPLYVEFLTEYRQALHDFGQEELAMRLAAWKEDMQSGWRLRNG